MKLLYAPWRSSYSKKSNNDCPFCSLFKADNDEENFIIKRFESCALVLNLYPYNAGHLLVVPYNHSNSLQKLSKIERAQLIEYTSISCNALETVLNCEGINIGLNIGKISGGSIPDHIHMHIIPRWMGDTNFLVTTAETKAISFDLHKIYKELTSFFNNSGL